MTRAIAYLFALSFLLLVGGAAFAQTDQQRINKALEELDATVNAARRARYAIEQLTRPVEPAPEPEPEPGPQPLPEPEPAPSGFAIPAYFPMESLRPVETVLHVLCDESMAAGKHLLAAGEQFPWQDYVGTGGVEVIYEATDDAGRACVYPFAPWQPRRGGGSNEWADGEQFIWRTDQPGKQVTFRSGGAWDAFHFKSGNLAARLHVEVHDFVLDFPRSIQMMGALWIEAFPRWDSEGLVTVAIDNTKVRGGKNAVFLPGGRTMLYAHGLDILGNVGTNTETEHGTYINGALLTHFENSSWTGQLANGVDGGHQLKNKALIQIYEDVSVDNRAGASDPSNRVLMDLIGYGYVWAEDVSLTRVAPAVPREGLIHLRSKGGTSYLPSDVLPEAPVAVFRGLTVDSYRTEPHVIENHFGGALYVTDAEGDFESVARAKDEVRGDALLEDRDAFIRHALGLVE